nr:MAG TPA_asm: hypothetical protein [Caudoviricetes sp.]
MIFPYLTFFYESKRRVHLSFPSPKIGAFFVEIQKRKR